MSCEDAEQCDSEQMEKDYCRRWERYNKIGKRQPCGNNGNGNGNGCNGNGNGRNGNGNGGNGNGNGYQCKMAVNSALSKLINSSGEIVGRIRRKNGDITLDLMPVKPQSGSLCCKSKQPESQLSDKQRILRKMDYLECELDAVARKLKKEAKKKIERQKQAEEEAAAAAEAAAAEEEEEEGGEEEVEEEEEERTGKYKEVIQTVRKEKIINENGVEETVTTTTKDQVQSKGQKQIRTVTTTEEHKTPGGGGYTIVTTEKTVKGGKHNEYKMIKKEKIKSRDDDSNSNAKAPQVKHREKTDDVTYDEDGKRHEVKVDATETTKGQKHKVKRIVETKDEGEDGNIVYEKTITKTTEEEDKNKC